MIPGVVSIAAILAKVLTLWMPMAWLQWLLATLNGMPEAAARTTAAFVKSSTGVRQALFLARDELRNITADRWDDDLWGVSKANKSGGKRTKLFFYFGEHDYWVANETRDQLIAARASTGAAGDRSKPMMEIDRRGIDHAFCLSAFLTGNPERAYWLTSRRTEQANRAQGRGLRAADCSVQLVIMSHE